MEYILYEEIITI